MHVSVTAPHQEFSPGMRVHLEERLQRLENYFGGLSSVKAIFECRNGEHEVELIASAGGTVLAVDAHAESFRGAFGRALDRMERSLRKRKAKLRMEQRRKARESDT